LLFVGNSTGNYHRTDDQQSIQATLQKIHICSDEWPWHCVTWSHAERM